MKTQHVLLIGTFFLLVTTVQAQSTVIPQIADGGGWQTTLVLTNTSASAASASLSFYQETNGGATQSWNPGFLETSSPQNLSLPGGGTLFLHTPGTAGSTTTGWAQLQAGSSVAAYAIFTERVPGRQDQDGTALAAAAVTRVLVPFDNTSGFVTAIAIANPNSSSESISVGLQSSDGSVTQASPITLPASGHTSFALSQQFAATNGQSGLAEFYSSSGSISVLALRFNPTGAFATAPVFPGTGSPIIGGAVTGGSSFPVFQTLKLSSSIASGALSGFAVGITLSNFGPGLLQCDASAENAGPTGPIFTNLYAIVGWGSYSVNGLTATCTQTNPSSIMVNYANGTQAQITTATLTLTLSPQTVSTSGTVSGTINLVSTVGTISGNFTGTYTAN